MIKMKLEIKDEQGRIDVVLSKMLDESRSKIQRPAASVICSK